MRAGCLGSWLGASELYALIVKSSKTGLKRKQAGVIALQNKAASLLHKTASLQNLQSTFNYIISHDPRARKLKHNSYIMRCVAHADKHASLAVTLKHNKILLYCFANCSVNKILKALSLSASDLFEKQDYSEEIERKRLKAEIRRLDAEINTKAKEVYNKLACLHRRFLALAQNEKQQDNAFFAIAARKIDIAHLEYLLDCLMSRSTEDKQYALNSKYTKELMQLCK